MRTFFHFPVFSVFLSAEVFFPCGERNEGKSEEVAFEAKCLFSSVKPGLQAGDSFEHFVP